jgi:hypothetical protein
MGRDGNRLEPAIRSNRIELAESSELLAGEGKLPLTGESFGASIGSLIVRRGKRLHRVNPRDQRAARRSTNGKRRWG